MLSPDPTETIARARGDLRLGLPVASGPVLLAAAETVSADRLA
ncbi:MAG: GTP cyclohydrolase II, partial [Jannaschia sp.]